MADATRSTRDVETVIVAKEPVIRLELSEAEARTLHVIYAYVGGDPESSPSGHIGAIGEALGKVFGGALKYRDHPEYALLVREVGIRFNDYPAEPEAPRVPRVFAKGDTIPPDVFNVIDKDGRPEYDGWHRQDGQWKANNYSFIESEAVLLSEYGPVTEVID